MFFIVFCCLEVSKYKDLKSKLYKKVVVSRNVGLNNVVFVVFVVFVVRVVFFRPTPATHVCPVSVSLVSFSLYSLFLVIRY